MKKIMIIMLGLCLGIIMCLTEVKAIDKELTTSLEKNKESKRVNKNKQSKKTNVVKASDKITISPDEKTATIESVDKYGDKEIFYFKKEGNIWVNYRLETIYKDDSWYDVYNDFFITKTTNKNCSSAENPIKYSCVTKVYEGGTDPDDVWYGYIKQTDESYELMKGKKVYYSKGRTDYYLSKNNNVKRENDVEYYSDGIKKENEETINYRDDVYNSTKDYKIVTWFKNKKVKNKEYVTFNSKSIYRTYNLKEYYSNGKLKASGVSKTNKKGHGTTFKKTTKYKNGKTKEKFSGTFFKKSRQLSKYQYTKYRSNGKKQYKKITYLLKQKYWYEDYPTKVVTYTYNKKGQKKSNKYGNSHKYVGTIKLAGENFKTKKVTRAKYSSKGKLAKAKKVKITKFNSKWYDMSFFSENMSYLID